MFCLVDDRLPDIPKRPQAKGYPSELVTIGVLFALKSGFFRAFSRWLKRDDGDWFGDGTLPNALVSNACSQRITIGVTRVWLTHPSSPSLTALQLTCWFPSVTVAARTTWATKAETRVAGVLESRFAGW